MSFFMLLTCAKCYLESNIKKMKLFRKNVLVSAFSLFFIFGVTSHVSATTVTVAPPLQGAACYAVLSNAYTNTNPGTTINGDLGYTTGPATVPTVNGATHAADASYTQAGADQSAALSALNSQQCTHTFPPGNVDLATDTTHGTQGVYTPGVYCTSGGGVASIGAGGITLTGGPSGSFIFRVGGLVTAANSAITLTGVSEGSVFWTPATQTMLGDNSAFAGTVIDDAGITVGANTTWTGRALSFGGTVTTDSNTITAPVCTGPPPNVPYGTFHIVKVVVNTNGGTAVPSDFLMHLKYSGSDISGSPTAGADAPGTRYFLEPNTYMVSEDPNAAYTSSFSGGCDASGTVTIADGEDKTCTVTNTEITASVPPPPPPPIATLHVVKVVVNDDGGTAVVSDFNLHVELSGVDVSGSPAVGTASPGTSYTLSPGAYTVSEDANTSYVGSFSGDCDASGNVTLTDGDNKVCTIINNDIAAVPVAPLAPPVIPPPPPAPATLHIIKSVVNLSVGTSTPANFILHVKSATSTLDVSGSPAFGTSTPGTAYTLMPGLYTVSEDVNVYYGGHFSGDCDASGNITLASGDNKTCTITNTDIAPPPVISPAVVPPPPVVPASSGGGGGGGGGSPAPTPLIHIVKTASPTVLPQGPALVTYVYTVTNTGPVPMYGVWVKDNKCEGVSFISGDTNNNSLLDLNEIWTYQCAKVLQETETNIATTHGAANGWDVYDTASATVVVTPSIVPALPNAGTPSVAAVSQPYPAFPNTGFPPKDNAGIASVVPRFPDVGGNPNVANLQTSSFFQAGQKTVATNNVLPFQLYGLIVALSLILETSVLVIIYPALK